MSNEQQSSSSFQVIDDGNGNGNNNGDNHDNNPTPITQFSPQAQAHSKEPEEEEVAQEEEATQEEAEAAAIPPEAAAIPPAPVPPQQPPAVALPSTPLARNTASQPSTPAAPFLQSNLESPAPAPQRPTPATPSIPSIPEAPPATQTARSIDQLLPQASKMEADADLKLISEMNQEQDDSEEEFDADVNDPSSVEENDLLVPFLLMPMNGFMLALKCSSLCSLHPPCDSVTVSIILPTLCVPSNSGILLLESPIQHVLFLKLLLMIW